jgi:arylsulfatase A-like enzyme
MVLFAPGAVHSPPAPPEYIEKYRGKFDMGWDRARELILEKQKKLGIVPPDTKLTERVPAIPAWDSLSADEKKLYARQMEVFAAMLEHVDHEVGPIVATPGARLVDADLVHAERRGAQGRQARRHSG